MPDIEGRKFSVWHIDYLISPEAALLVRLLPLRLESFRNFRLDANARHATMLHRDHPSAPCFAVSMCIRGHAKVHFYDDMPPAFEQKAVGKEGSNPFYMSDQPPRETYSVKQGELFIMDTSTIHQADTSECDSPVLLVSFVPKPQYRYEDALRNLGLLCPAHPSPNTLGSVSSPSLPELQSR